MKTDSQSTTGLFPRLVCGLAAAVFCLAGVDIVSQACSEFGPLSIPAAFTGVMTIAVGLLLGWGAIFVHD